MTHTVQGRLVIGFRAGPLYLGWPKARRAILARAVFIDILAKTADTRRITWLGVPVELDDEDMIDESAIRDLILEELAKTGEIGSLDPYVLDLRKDNQDVPLPPVEITYVIVGGEIICQHNYLLTHLARDGTSPRMDWVVADGNEPADVVAQFEFELALA